MHEHYNKILTLLSNSNPQIQALGEQLLESSNMSELDKIFVRAEAEEENYRREIDQAGEQIKRINKLLREEKEARKGT
mgnify:CR=1 FL=1